MQGISSYTASYGLNNYYPVSTAYRADTNGQSAQSIGRTSSPAEKP